MLSTNSRLARLYCELGRVEDAEGLEISVRNLAEEDIDVVDSGAKTAVERIDWPDGYCRTDIGWRAVERERG